jgi:Fe-S cluster assembly iron-binding protein IscA
MQEIKITVLELFALRNYLMGLPTDDGKILIPGFLNEKGLTEGIKRRANKALKIIVTELDPICKQLDSLRTVENAENEKKEKELLEDKVTISVEKMDFKLIENVSLSFNYQVLYDHLFVE